MDIDAIRKKYLSAKAEQESRGKKTRPTDGKNTYRILPRPKAKKYPYREAGLHYNLGDEKKTVEFCLLKTVGDPCPICEFVGGLYDENDKASKDLAGEIKSRSKFYFPVIVRGKEEAGPKVLEVGEKAWTQIMGIIVDIFEETGVSIADPIKGRDIIIDRQGKGFMTEYYVRAGASPSKLSKSKSKRKKWVADMTDVDDYVEEGLLSQDDLLKVLEQDEEKSEEDEEEELEEEETEEEETEEEEEPEEDEEEEEEPEEDEEEEEEPEEDEEEEEEDDPEEDEEEEEELDEEDFEEDEETGKVKKKKGKKKAKKKVEKKKPAKKKSRQRSGAVDISKALKNKIKKQGGKKAASKKRKTKK